MNPHNLIAQACEKETCWWYNLQLIQIWSGTLLDYQVSDEILDGAQMTWAHLLMSSLLTCRWVCLHALNIQFCILWM